MQSRNARDLLASLLDWCTWPVVCDRTDDSGAGAVDASRTSSPSAPARSRGSRPRTPRFEPSSTRPAGPASARRRRSPRASAARPTSASAPGAALGSPTDATGTAWRRRSPTRSSPPRCPRPVPIAGARSFASRTGASSTKTSWSPPSCAGGSWWPRDAARTVSAWCTAGTPSRPRTPSGRPAPCSVLGPWRLPVGCTTAVAPRPPRSPGSTPSSGSRSPQAGSPRPCFAWQMTPRAPTTPYSAPYGPQRWSPPMRPPGASTASGVGCGCSWATR